MAGVRVEWKRGAFRAARSSPEVLAELVKRAERIAAASGDGFEVDSGITGGRGRARASVRTATRSAVKKNAAENTLLRNLDRGRG
jgi:hypothetical protein